MRSLALAVSLVAVSLGAAPSRPSTGGAPPPPGADLFNHARVLRLRVETGPAALAGLRRDPRKYVNATIHEGSAGYTNVGLHLKGAIGSFRTIDDKPSLTLSFDRQVESRRFHGLRKIHLNNSVEDPSYLSELLGSELFRAAGVPAARVTHAVVELNGRALGLYVLKEGFTEDFLALHFGNPHSRLYEPGPGHDVNEELDEKAGPAAPDRAGLDALASAIAIEDLAQRWQRVRQTLDVERFLSFMALEVMLGHRDGYCLARNNFRLALDGGFGRMVFLAHGMDQLFGRSPPSVEPRMTGLVAKGVLETPDGRDAYRRRFGGLLTNTFNSAALVRRIDALADLLRPAVPAPEKRGFQEAVSELKSRIAQRREEMQRQLARLQAPLLQNTTGAAVLSGWQKFGEPVNGAMQETQSGDGRKLLHIQAGPGTTASWRTTARLPAGRYRFEGSVRTARVKPLTFGNSQGAVLRIWRPASARSAAAPFDSAGEKLSVEFELPREDEVYLGCEIRASAGDAWFDAASLRLVRVPPRPSEPLK
jgi:hypothetical protein